MEICREFLKAKLKFTYAADAQRVFWFQELPEPGTALNFNKSGTKKPSTYLILLQQP